MDNPLLKDRLAARIGVEGAAVSIPPGRPAVLHSGAEVRGRRCLRLRGRKGVASIMVSGSFRGGAYDIVSTTESYVIPTDYAPLIASFATST